MAAGVARQLSPKAEYPCTLILKFREMASILSLEILYILSGRFCYSTKRSMMVERCVSGPGSRMRVLQVVNQIALFSLDDAHPFADERLGDAIGLVREIGQVECMAAHGERANEEAVNHFRRAHGARRSSDSWLQRRRHT